jgi:hypothetical protein
MVFRDDTPIKKIKKSINTPSRKTGWSFGANWALRITKATATTKLAPDIQKKIKLINEFLSFQVGK